MERGSKLISKPGEVPRFYTPLKDTSYGSVHVWLHRTFKKTGTCEHCKTEAKTDWAKLRGKPYAHVRENFWELCRKCHNFYDSMNWLLRDKTKKYILSWNAELKEWSAEVINS